MKLSLYWTTRNRVGYLAYVISSWLQNANNPENIEILVAIDEDDSQTEEVLEQINHCTHMISGNDISYIKTERYGHEYIDRYHNQIGKIFTGECLMAICDDMICDTKGWDDILISSLQINSHKPTFIWTDCDTNNIANGAYSPLPRLWGINRKWYETTQHVVGWRAGDEYFKRLLTRVENSVEIVKPKFQVYNLRQENDTTYNEGRGALKPADRGSCDDFVEGDFERDIKKLIGE